MSRLVLMLFCFSRCAGTRPDFAFAPRMMSGASAMDETHEENFRMPDIEKQSAEEKISGALLGAAVVGSVVATATVIVLLAKDKL